MTTGENKRHTEYQRDFLLKAWSILEGSTRRMPQREPWQALVGLFTKDDRRPPRTTRHYSADDTERDEAWAREAEGEKQHRGGTPEGDDGGQRPLGGLDHLPEAP